MVAIPGLGRLQSAISRVNRDDVEDQRAPSEVAQANIETPGFRISQPMLPTLLRTRVVIDVEEELPDDFRNNRQRLSPRYLNANRVAPVMAGGNGNGLRGVDGDLESPKTPRFFLRLPFLPSTRLHLPHLVRTWTTGSNGPSSRPGTASSEVVPRIPFSAFPSRARSPNQAPLSMPHPLSPRSVRLQGRTVSQDDSDDGPLPISNPQTNPRMYIANDGSHPTNRLSSPAGRDEPSGQGDVRLRQPQQGADGAKQRQKFLFCFPAVKSRRLRAQILRCFLSGLFLTFLLSIYLALSITKNINNSEFTVLLILIILFTTIFFCHGLIKLCLMVMKPRQENDGRELPPMVGIGGYAIPREPIRVVLARDEEAAGVESESTKLKPPAYGLWRESVRVDPNRLFWQRNAEAVSNDDFEASASARATPNRTEPRPPSYCSEDGVAYVVEAQPRSIAPITDAQLPPHPSERGRLPGGATSW